MTKAFSLSNGTTQVLAAGRYLIKRADLSYTAAATATFYDDSDSTHTQSNPAYTAVNRLDPVSRTGSTTTDIYGNTVSYTYTGQYTYNSTVAANATYPVPAILSLSLPGAGAVGTDTRLVITQGLSVTCTAAATLILDYELVP